MSTLKRWSFTLALTALVGLFLAGWAVAQPPRMGGGDTPRPPRVPQGTALTKAVNEADTDEDGMISRTEFIERMNAVFDELDEDDNGILDAKESVRAVQGRPGQVWGPPPAGEPRPALQGGMGMPESRWQKIAERFDMDKDGRISRDEWKGPEGAFGDFDTNQDGFLTKEEAATAQFDRQDADGDGRITLEEFKGGAEYFARLDVNADGAVTQEELKQAAQKFRARMQSGEGAERPEQARQARQDRMKSFLKRHDKDGDGKVAVDEFQGPTEVFSTFDTDKDGFVTTEEIQNREHRGGEGREKPEDGARRERGGRAQ
ncbi:EF-hand domain-containing protein [bacterium]|nr:EF-hand domain-containing protein [bacterium]